MALYKFPGKCAILCLFSIVFIAALATADDELENLLLSNPGFEQDFVDWFQGVQGGAAAIMEIDSKDSIDGDKSAHTDIATVTGTNWHVGMTHSGLVLKQGTLYTVDFFAKADVGRVISVEMKVVSPYEGINQQAYVITEEWTEYSHSFTPTRDFPPGDAQIAFWLGQVTGEVWLDGVRVYEGEKQDREDVLPDISVEAEGKLITSWATIKASY